jgi:hypothetical protein
MKPTTCPLKIRRTSCCEAAGAPTIKILLLNGETPVVRYLANSLADARRYEEQTLGALRDCSCEIRIVVEDVSDCPRCARRPDCM